MNRKPITLSIFLCAFTAVTGDAASDPCYGQCENGGLCVEGPADFANHTNLMDDKTFHVEKTINGKYHCECPHGWTGTRCDIVFESCSESHQCYHNGKCIPGLIDKYGHEQLFCDCSNAVDENKNMYVGKYCEHRAVDYCTDGNNFCVNGGQCNNDYPDLGKPCYCYGGYEGPHCEFKVGSVPKCDLDCANGGHCVLHVAEPKNTDGTIKDQFWDDVIDQNDGFKYCACPPGYGGPLCDVKKDECGSGHCFHGSTCLNTSAFGDDDPEFYCDCNSANTDDISFAGRYCQYEATSYCAKHPKLNHHLFCVNGGTCKEDIYKGCDCPDGYDGFSCEFKVDSKNDTDVDSLIDSEDFQVITQDEISQAHSKIGKCGDESCMHGSVCVHSSDFGNNEGNEGDYCDCSTADDEDMSYAGRYCQYEATSYCSKNPGINHHLFCVNGGTCKKNVYEGCDCPDGFAGFNCDYTMEEFYASTDKPTEVDIINEADKPDYLETQETTVFPHENIVTARPSLDDPDYIHCENLMCLNGGTCRKGAKQLGELSDIVKDIDHLNSTYSEDFDHCVCSPGFVGLRCEHKVETCGNGEHFCLHGSKCIKNSEDNSHGCDCSSVTSKVSSAFAGNSCEHKATAICTVGDFAPGKPLSFCVNGGYCLKEVTSEEGHAGCNCPKNWMGPHCELKKRTDNDIKNENALRNQSNQQSATKSKVTILVISIIAFLSAIAITITLIIRKQRKKSRSNDNALFGNDSIVSYRDSYRDEPSEHCETNLAPRQDCNVDPLPDRFSSSTTSVMKAMTMAPSDSTPEANQTQRDEGLHQLHQVDII